MEEQKKTRGGYRPGAGRPTKCPIGTTRLGLRVSSDVAEILRRQPNMTAYIEQAVRDKFNYEQ